MTTPDPNNPVPGDYQAAPPLTADAYPVQPQLPQPPQYAPGLQPHPQYAPGYQQSQPPPFARGYQPAQRWGVPAKSNSLAVSSLWLGIASLFCVGFIVGIPAIITGIIGKRQIAESQGTQGGDGQALWGIILGSAGTVVSFIAFVVWMAASAEAPPVTYP